MNADVLKIDPGLATEQITTAIRNQVFRYPLLPRRNKVQVVRLVDGIRDRRCAHRSGAAAGLSGILIYARQKDVPTNFYCWFRSERYNLDWRDNRLMLGLHLDL